MINTLKILLVPKGSVLKYAKQDMGLYDSATGKTVYACKIVDATHLCTNSGRLVIKYGKVKRGLIAQICDWYKQDEDMGATVHYHINEMRPVKLAKDCVFELRCKCMETDAPDLANFIFDNQPR